MRLGKIISALFSSLRFSHNFWCTKYYFVFYTVLLVLFFKSMTRPYNSVERDIDISALDYLFKM